MKRHWENNANGKAGNATQERHDPVERRTYNGNDHECDRRKYAKSEFEYASVDAGHAVQRGIHRQRAAVETGEYLERRDDRAGVEWNLGKRYDGNTNGDEGGQRFWVSP